MDGVPGKACQRSLKRIFESLIFEGDAIVAVITENNTAGETMFAIGTSMVEELNACLSKGNNDNMSLASIDSTFYAVSGANKTRCKY